MLATYPSARVTTLMGPVWYADAEAQTAALRDCFDEWVLCTPSALSLEHFVAVANTLFKSPYQ